LKIKNLFDFSQCEAVILDMDGVLVDTEPIHADSFRVFLKQLNIPFTEDFIDGLVGYSIDHNIQTINSVFLTDNPMDLSAGIRRRDEIYLSMINQRILRPIEGIESLLSLCRRRGLKLALASSSVREQIDCVLKNLSVNDPNSINYINIFEVTVSGDEVENKKPAADIYERALKLLDISANKCFTIEDSQAGILSAKSNGIYCFALRNQYLKPNMMDGADCIINSISEVVSLMN
jgi:beta-phosphoglucomutase-like phosphatase (HAD superfamily)